MRLIDIRRIILTALSSVNDPIHEADVIISHVYGLDKTQMTLRAADDFDYISKIDDIISRRTSGDPLEYIIGKTTFFGLDFFVSPACLIPRADTEVVVEEALRHVKGTSRFLDLCTGSGCIAVSLSKFGAACGVALDISDMALSVAEKNAESNGVDGKIKFILGDVLGDIGISEKFDLIVSNPPYVKTDVIPTLPREVRREPVIALDGGYDGMVFYKCIISKAPTMLKKNGVLVMEIGYDESIEVGALLDEYGFEYNVIRDYGGNDRCITAHIKREEI